MKAPLTGQKLRGGYYTPRPIAEFLARWAVRSRTDSVLEPSCGDGNIVVEAARRLMELGADCAQAARGILAVEYDADEAVKARARLQEVGVCSPNGCVRTSDFFRVCQTELIQQPLIDVQGKQFNAVLGNPPFVRYQNFPEEHRARAFRLMEQAGLHPNRLTNAWAPFLVVAAELLTPDGRLAMVIPAELFQVGYAAELREYLTNRFRRITILTFRRLIFEDIQQEVVLLLCERQAPGEGVRVIELEDAAALAGFSVDNHAATELKPMDHSTEKWTQYYLDTEEIRLLRTLRADPRLTRSGDVLDVDVGVVTGENSFFVLKEQAMAHYDLTSYVRPIVTRSAHLTGAIFTEQDWRDNVTRQYPANLLNAPDADIAELPACVCEYLKVGEAAAVPTGYKCRIRKRWYVVPSVWIPEAFLLRQVHGYPKLILNKAGATSTDTVHRVRFRNGAEGRAVTAAFVNSITLAFAEVTGRSYGGGVLTFEPSEAEYLPLPLLGAEALDLDHIDALLRAGDVEAALDITDTVLLEQGLGMDRTAICRIRAIWQKLRDRRIYRR